MIAILESSKLETTFTCKTAKHSILRKFRVVGGKIKKIKLNILQKYVIVNLEII